MYIQKIMPMFLLFLFISFSTVYSSCPPVNNKRHAVKNHYGDSLYKNSATKYFIQYLQKKYSLDLSKPILDAGAGYGAGAYEMIRLGAKNIYINDLSKATLYCANKHIALSLKSFNYKIDILDGDITNKEVIKKIPNNSLGMVYSVDMIQFMSIKSLVTFYKNAYKKLVKNGVIFTIFENPVLVQQEALLYKIKTENIKNNKLNSEIMLDSIVRERYNGTFFGATVIGITFPEYKCSYSSYKSLPKYLKMFGLTVRV